MDTVHFKNVGSAFLLLLLLAACSMGQRTAVENQAVRAKAAQEIHRICALADPEREAEIKRVKDESGLLIACPARRTAPTEP